MRRRDEIDGYLEAIRDPDVLVGGFPCQDISVAGKGGGLAGRHSSLWFDMRRCIGLLRPKLVIVENVPRLLAGDRGRWFGTLLGDLAALGYDAEWHCVQASDVAAPHGRDRVWIIAHSADAIGDPVWKQLSERHPRGWDELSPEGEAELRHDGADGDLADPARVLEGRGQKQRTERERTRAGGQPRRRERADADRSGLEGRNGGLLQERPGEGLARSCDPFVARPRWDFERAVTIGLVEIPDARQGGGEGAGRELGERAASPRGKPQSRLGRSLDGLPEGMDRPWRGAWRPGWEDGIPRAAIDIPDRIKRLEGLGNAVVPPLVKTILRCVIGALSDGQTQR